MRKAMISQPMAGKTNEQITEQRNKAIEVLEGMGYEVVDSYFAAEHANPESMKKRGVVNIPVGLLSKAIEKMSECEALYCCKGWEDARGCKIEHLIAEEYGIEIIEEDE